LSSNIGDSLPETGDEGSYRARAEEIRKIERSSRERVGEEIGKIYGIIKRLEAEISQEKLTRSSCNSALTELKASLHILSFSYSVFIGLRYKWEVPISSTKLIEDYRKSVQELTKSFISFVDIIINKLSNPTLYEDEDARKDIRNLISLLKPFLYSLSMDVQSSPTGIFQIAELVAMKPMNLDESWAVANCYLSAMEIVVNRRLREEGVKLEKKEKKYFANRFKALIKVLENRGVEISELEKELPLAFWNLRNKVVHAGYNPTQDELKLIITWVQKIIKILITT
jgi:hypothetical protein